MSIQNDADLEGMKAVGRIVRLALAEMAFHLRRHIAGGITTAALAAVGGNIMRRHGARSAPALVYGFPGDVLISLNDEAVHGVPSARVIAPGDLVKLDVTFEKDGYMADAAVTIPLEPAGTTALALSACARRAFHAARRLARPGMPVRELGRAIEIETRRAGFRVIRDLAGHGIGRTIHEPPRVPNFADPSATERLAEGMVLTIEPIIAAGSAIPLEGADGWTVRTADGGLAAHFEHTLLITAGLPRLLTA